MLYNIACMKQNLNFHGMNYKYYLPLYLKLYSHTAEKLVLLL